MSVRIEMFAAQRERFCRTIDLPLSHLLRAMRNRESGDLVPFGICDNRQQIRFFVAPERKVFKLSMGSGKKEPITDDSLQNELFLRQSIRDYLNSSSSYEFANFLRVGHVYNDCFAIQLMRGFTRWWIGSLLAAAARLWYSAPPYRELEKYLARILRGYNCGVQMHSEKGGLSNSDFPVIPLEDIDYRVSILSADELRNLVELLENLMQCRSVFQRPPLLSINDDQTDWDGFVREMIQKISAAHRADFSEVSLVSFIG